MSAPLSEQGANEDKAGFSGGDNLFFAELSPHGAGGAPHCYTVSTIFQYESLRITLPSRKV